MANHKLLTDELSYIEESITRNGILLDNTPKEDAAVVDLLCQLINHLESSRHVISVYLSELRIDLAKEHFPELW